MYVPLFGASITRGRRKIEIILTREDRVYINISSFAFTKGRFVCAPATTYYPLLAAKEAPL